MLNLYQQRGFLNFCDHILFETNLPRFLNSELGCKSAFLFTSQTTRSSQYVQYWTHFRLSSHLKVTKIALTKTSNSCELDVKLKVMWWTPIKQLYSLRYFSDWVDKNYFSQSSKRLGHASVITPLSWCLKSRKRSNWDLVCSNISIFRRNR